MLFQWNKLALLNSPKNVSFFWFRVSAFLLWIQNEKFTWFRLLQTLRKIIETMQPDTYDSIRMMTEDLWLCMLLWFQWKKRLVLSKSQKVSLYSLFNSKYFLKIKKLKWSLQHQICSLLKHFHLGRKLSALFWPRYTEHQFPPPPVKSPRITDV